MAKSVENVERFSSLGRKIEDVKVTVNRTGDGIYMFIENDKTTKSYMFTLEQFMELLGGTITPAELNRQYGIGE